MSINTTVTTVTKTDASNTSMPAASHITCVPASDALGARCTA